MNRRRLKKLKVNSRTRNTFWGYRVGIWRNSEKKRWLSWGVVSRLELGIYFWLRSWVKFWLESFLASINLILSWNPLICGWSAQSKEHPQLAPQSLVPSSREIKYSPVAMKKSVKNNADDEIHSTHQFILGRTLSNVIKYSKNWPS